MSNEPKPTSPELQRLAKEVPGAEHAQGLFGGNHPLETPEMVADRIEMMGEETAAGFTPPKHSEVTAGMRYLHASRTIAQLITDRNRAVGLYLAVISVLVAACTALLNVKVYQHPTTGELLPNLGIPLETIQKWCLPVTFGTMSVLSLLFAFLLIRTRAGLIYEAAKMNALLGLPIGRVSHLNPLSIFFIMHTLVSLAGGLSAALFSLDMLARPTVLGLEHHALTLAGVLIGLGVTTFLIVLYVATVSYITSDKKLKALK